jgi:hypothetical protein
MAFPKTPGYSHGKEATMTVDQRLLQTLHVLPAARQQELLDFAEFLRSQTDEAPKETRCKLTPLPVLRPCSLHRSVTATEARGPRDDGCVDRRGSA